MTQSPAIRRFAAFMSVNTQFENLGDALINRELARLLAERMPTTIDFSRCPDSFRRTMDVEGDPNVTSLTGAGYLKMLGRMFAERLRGATCYLFLNPGGLGGKEKRLSQVLSGSANNLLLTAMRLCGIRVCQVGVSYGNLMPRDRWVTRWRLKNLYSVAVRDQISFDYLRDNGLRVDEIVPDLSFHLYDRPLATGSDPRSIAMSFRSDGGSVSPEQAELFSERLMTAAGPGYVYKFISQVMRDDAPMRALFERLQAKKPGFQCQYIACSDDIGRMIVEYQDCAAIYSNRLHGLLLAAYAGAVPYAVILPGKNAKIVGLFASLGLDDQVLTFDSPQPPAPSGRVDIQVMRREANILSRYFDRLASQGQ